MLDRLFSNPAEKLQKFLKFIFAGTTCIEILFAIIYFCIQIGNAARFRNWGGIILSLFLLVLIPVISIIYNYICCLFSYMILSFFADIHDIRNKINKTSE